MGFIADITNTQKVDDKCLAEILRQGLSVLATGKLIADVKGTPILDGVILNTLEQAFSPNGQYHNNRHEFIHELINLKNKLDDNVRKKQSRFRPLTEDKLVEKLEYNNGQIDSILAIEDINEFIKARELLILLYQENLSLMKKLSTPGLPIEQGKLKADIDSALVVKHTLEDLDIKIRLFNQIFIKTKDYFFNLPEILTQDGPLKKYYESQLSHIRGGILAIKNSIKDGRANGFVLEPVAPHNKIVCKKLSDSMLEVDSTLKSINKTVPNLFINRAFKIENIIQEIQKILGFTPGDHTEISSKIDKMKSNLQAAIATNMANNTRDFSEIDKLESEIIKINSQAQTEHAKFKDKYLVGSSGATKAIRFFKVVQKELNNYLLGAGKTSFWQAPRGRLFGFCGPVINKPGMEQLAIVSALQATITMAMNVSGIAEAKVHQHLLLRAKQIKAIINDLIENKLSTNNSDQSTLKSPRLLACLANIDNSTQAGAIYSETVEKLAENEDFDPNMSLTKVYRVNFQKAMKVQSHEQQVTKTKNYKDWKLLREQFNSMRELRGMPSESKLNLSI